MVEMSLQALKDSKKGFSHSCSPRRKKTSAMKIAALIFKKQKKPQLELSLAGLTFSIVIPSNAHFEVQLEESTKTAILILQFLKTWGKNFD